MRQELRDLTQELNDVVVTLVRDDQTSGVELRRVLQFVAEVIGVVQQAFQHVTGVLVEISLLEAPELNDTGRMRELKRETALLSDRKQLHDVALICQRLAVLEESFKTTIQPSISHHLASNEWSGILGLINEHEGRIIRLVDHVAWEISEMLDTISPATLPATKAAARTRRGEVGALLSSLHELYGRLLGVSGKTGFLELTATRDELQREVTIMLDNRDQSSNVNVSGSHVTGNVTAARNIQGSFNTTPVSADLEKALAAMKDSFEAIRATLPPATQKALASDIETLEKEARAETPRKKWYQLSGEGIIEAATACGSAAAPLVSAVRSVLGLLAG